MKKTIAFLLTVCLVLSFVGSALASSVSFIFYNNGQQVSFSDAVMKKSGDGSQTSVFIVHAYQDNASVTLKQQKGNCEERKRGYHHTADVWGMYEIRYQKCNNGGVYVNRWEDSTFTLFNSTYTIKFPSVGWYYVAVRPYTANEMTNAWISDKFVSWNRVPTWEISSATRCITGTDTPFWKANIKYVSGSNVLYTTSKIFYFGDDYENVNRANYSIITAPPNYTDPRTGIEYMLKEGEGGYKLSNYVDRDATFQYVRKQETVVSIIIQCRDRATQNLIGVFYAPQTVSGTVTVTVTPPTLPGYTCESYSPEVFTLSSGDDGRVVTFDYRSQNGSSTFSEQDWNTNVNQMQVQRTAMIAAKYVDTPSNPGTPSGSRRRGDVNGDGQINTLDAIMIVRYKNGAVSVDTTYADVNMDGTVNILDAIMIVRYKTGAISL